MPRPTTHRHILGDLRRKIKRTQAQFAKLLGVSRIYINKIENGQTPVSPSLAIRVHILTGINIDELVKGCEGKLIDAAGRPYEEETFIWWQKKLYKPSEADAARVARNLGWWTFMLLRAAVIHKKGVAYSAVIAALLQSLSTIRNDFGLVESTDRLLRECTPPMKWLPGGRTAAELLQIERELQKALEDAAALPAGKVTWYLLPKSKRPSPQRRRKV